MEFTDMLNVSPASQIARNKHNGEELELLLCKDLLSWYSMKENDVTKILNVTFKVRVDFFILCYFLMLENR